MYITESGDRHLKVVWSEGSTFWRPYLISRALLQGAADGVRQELVKVKSRWTPGGANYGDSVCELAKKGLVLHDVLFPADARPGDPSKRVADELLYPPLTSDAIDLTITSDASVHVPWGLVYRGDRAQLNQKQTSSAIGDYPGFWSRMFTMRTLFAERDPQPNHEAIDREAFRLLYIHDSVEWNEMSGKLPLGEKLQVENHLWTYDVGRATKWDESADKWSGMADNEGILFVFGHSNGTALSLRTPQGDTETITPAEFRLLFRRTSSKPAVCFLNGCWTAAGEGENSFLNVATTGGFQGFVGAESTVPNLFATKYSTCFLTLVCDLGFSMQHAFDTLKEMLWPMSLIYGLYADPGFKVKPSEDPPDLEKLPWLDELLPFIVPSVGKIGRPV